MLTWLRMGHPLDYLISPNQTGTVCSFLGFSPPWVYVDTKPVGTVPQGNGSYLQPFHSLEDAEEALRLLDPEELRPSLYHYEDNDADLPTPVARMICDPSSCPMVKCEVPRCRAIVCAEHNGATGGATGSKMKVGTLHPPSTS